MGNGRVSGVYQKVRSRLCALRRMLQSVHARLATPKLGFRTHDQQINNSNHSPYRLTVGEWCVAAQRTVGYGALFVWS
jgi:hypothetical protein